MRDILKTTASSLIVAGLITAFNWFFLGDRWIVLVIINLLIFGSESYITLWKNRSRSRWVRLVKVYIGVSDFEILRIFYSTNTAQITLRRQVDILLLILIIVNITIYYVIESKEERKQNKTQKEE